MSVCSFYYALRAVLSPVDFVTDIVHGYHLLKDGHPFWAIITFSLPFVSLLAAIIYVVARHCGSPRTTDPMSLTKFLCLTYEILNKLMEALFESIPQLVLQCTAVWRGVFNFEDVR